jgi:hypothetical protein
MSLKRWNAKRDATEPAIVDALEQAGAKVIRLDVFDLLVLYHGRLFMFDAKLPKGRKTQSQLALVEEGWPLQFVTEPFAALRAIGAVR